MFRRFGPGNDTLDDISRVEILVRDRFKVSATDIMLVSEDPGTIPGFPPREPFHFYLLATAGVPP